MKKRELHVLLISIIILTSICSSSNIIFAVTYDELSGLIELIITLVGDILVMVIFIIAAIPAFNSNNFTDLFPIGVTPVLFAALVFFFSYIGFTLILDVAGEVKNPKKNIPKAF